MDPLRRRERPTALYRQALDLGRGTCQTCQKRGDAVSVGQQTGDLLEIRDWGNRTLCP